jgi:ComF family protein
MVRVNRVLVMRACPNQLVVFNLFSQSCYLCGNSSSQAICNACLKDLPYQTSACLNCATSLDEVGICPECKQNPPPYTHTQALFSYTYPIDKLIKLAKFHQNLTILKLLGKLMAQHLSMEPRPDVLIPVPLHSKRLRQRGYNQSLVLAKMIAKESGIPINTRVCKRSKYTRAQTSLLDAQQRYENLANAFKIKKIPSTWQHIVLIDDVMTTGTTVTQLALAFKAAGISQIDVWCCARA